MKAEDIALIARTVTPVVREFVEQKQLEMLRTITDLQQRMIELNTNVAKMTMTPGPQGPVGPAGPVGERGQDGAAGVQGLQGEAGPVGPAGADGAAGAAGKDGQDGKDAVVMTTDDVKAFHSSDGGRTLCLQFAKHDRQTELTIRTDALIYRGVYDPTTAYLAGDNVTYGGSLWVAKEDTTTRPGTPEGAKFWQLAVKKGADGKQGPKGDKGDPGPRGDKGMDGRNGY